MTWQTDERIIKAIDRGGGQTCDIPGVIRELAKAGFMISLAELPPKTHPCPRKCGRKFRTARAAEQHALDKHQS